MKTTIRIFGREQTTQEGTSYIRYSYTTDGKTFYDIRFTKSCDKAPNGTGYYLITLDTDNVKPYKNKKEGGNEVLKIFSVIDIEKDKKYEDLKKNERIKKVESILCPSTVETK